VVPEQKTSFIMLVLLIAMMVVYHVGLMIYGVLGEEPLPTFEFLYRYGFICGVVWFLTAESERCDLGRLYCPGVTLGMGWLFLLPYHLVKSRGVRGLIPLFGLFGTYLALQMLAAIVYVIFSGQAVL